MQLLNEDEIEQKVLGTDIVILNMSFDGNLDALVRKSFDLDELGLKDQIRTTGLGFAKNPKRPENEWSPEEKLIDSKMSLQFVSLGSNRGYYTCKIPWKDQELEQQFDLDHLPSKSKKHAIKTFKKHIDIFSRHEMDIGCATDIEMDIEIDNSKPRIQKYYPLPLNVREGVRKILDQMLEYGILRECPDGYMYGEDDPYTIIHHT